MNKTGISWTDFTWNPVSGCNKVSPGCQNCYAEAWSKRWKRSFDVTLHPEKLRQVKKIPSGSKVFVNSMSDLFHEKVPFSFIKDVIDAIKSRPDVIFQVLTKRPERIWDFLHHYWIDYQNAYWLPSNLWLGVSVEMRQYVKRIDELHDLRNLSAQLSLSPAFISFEPLIRDIGEVNLRGIDWIIIGGESGPHYRPMNIEWARNLIRQAKEQGVAVWMKQLGGFRPGGDIEDFPEDLRLNKMTMNTKDKRLKVTNIKAKFSKVSDGKFLNFMTAPLLLGHVEIPSISHLLGNLRCRHLA